MMNSLEKLNKREPKKAILKRLLKEAAKRTKHWPTIPEALEFRREAYGLTATAFAKVLGLQKGHYSEVVNGKRSLPIKARCRAARIGVPRQLLLND